MPLSIQVSNAAFCTNVPHFDCKIHRQACDDDARTGNYMTDSSSWITNFYSDLFKEKKKRNRKSGTTTNSTISLMWKQPNLWVCKDALALGAKIMLLKTSSSSSYVISSYTLSFSFCFSLSFPCLATHVFVRSLSFVACLLLVFFLSSYCMPSKQHY